MSSVTSPLTRIYPLDVCPATPYVKPVRRTTMRKPMTVTEFLKEFPDDDACLSHLFHVRYGNNSKCSRCGESGKFHRLSKLPAYTCNCGNHIHPMVGTPFHRSRTPLQKWFFAMFLFTTTRNGVAAKENQKEIGVTYKCAGRLAKLNRE